MFCLSKPLADKFKKLLKSGEISIEKLMDMNPQERHNFFVKVVGEENASQVNALFESKLLLKNQERGMINFIKQTTGMKPDVKRDLITKVQKIREVLTPEKQEDFLQDFVSQKVGTEVNFEQAQKIAQLSDKIDSFADGDVNKGLAMMEMKKYMDSLVPMTWRERMLSFVGVPRALMTTLDLSGAFRQGWGSIGTKEFWQAFPNMFRYYASDKFYNLKQAEMLVHPEYRGAIKNGLAIEEIGGKLSKANEMFMSNMLDKIPLVGKILKASNRAYSGFLNEVRFNRYLTLLEHARLAGEDVRVGSESMKALADMVNAFTGRANLGRLESSAEVLSTIFFAPRKVAATIQMFNPKTYMSASPTARKAALYQLLSSVGITTTILGLAGLAGADIEKDPRSADFGKIKIGNTRLEVTGGNNTYATFIARLATNQTKSTTSGKIIDYGEGYKPTTRFDISIRYARNKLSPVASGVADWMSGSTTIGEDFELKKALADRLQPIILNDLVDMYQQDADKGMILVSGIADVFGVGVQTYADKSPK